MNDPRSQRRGSEFMAALHGMAWGLALAGAAAFLETARQGVWLAVGRLIFFVLLLPCTGSVAFLTGLPLSKLQGVFCGRSPSFWGIFLTTIVAGPLLGALAFAALSWAASPLYGIASIDPSTLAPAIAGGIGIAFGAARFLLEERQQAARRSL